MLKYRGYTQNPSMSASMACFRQCLSVVLKSGFHEPGRHSSFVRYHMRCGCPEGQRFTKSGWSVDMGTADTGISRHAPASDYSPSDDSDSSCCKHADRSRRNRIERCADTPQGGYGAPRRCKRGAWMALFLRNGRKRTLALWLESSEMGGGTV